MDLQLLIVGDGQVGKTCLLMTYLLDTFPTGEYVPTVLADYTVTKVVENKEYIMKIYDTAGQEEYAYLRPLSYTNTDVFLLCFAVNDPVSYWNVENLWIREVKHYCPQAVVILVATKVDLRNDQATIENLKRRGISPVTFEEGKLLADTIRAYKYVECSALQSSCVKELFDIGLEAYLERKKRPIIRKRTCSIL